MGILELEWAVALAEHSSAPDDRLRELLQLCSSDTKLGVKDSTGGSNARIISIGSLLSDGIVIGAFVHMYSSS